MRRLLLFGALMALLAVLAAFAGPLERFVKFDETALTVNNNKLIMPTYNGAGFQPQKLHVYLHTNDAGVDSAAVTMYLPLSMGPAGASDSFTVTFAVVGSGDFKWEDYYGPMSDTMRVVTTANLTRGHFSWYGN